MYSYAGETDPAYVSGYYPKGIKNRNGKDYYYGPSYDTSCGCQYELGENGLPQVTLVNTIGTDGKPNGNVADQTILVCPQVPPPAPPAPPPPPSPPPPSPPPPSPPPPPPPTVFTSTRVRSWPIRPRPL